MANLDNDDGYDSKHYKEKKGHNTFISSNL